MTLDDSRCPVCVSIASDSKTSPPEPNASIWQLLYGSIEAKDSDNDLAGEAAFSGKRCRSIVPHRLTLPGSGMAVCNTSVLLVPNAVESGAWTGDRPTFPTGEFMRAIFILFSIRFSVRRNL